VTVPRDYDADPGRFLSSTGWPHDDVHPYVAARLAAAGARTVLDVGGGNGNLARLLPGLSIRCALVDLSPATLALAPRPAVLADGARLPVAEARVDAVAALYTLYHYDDPLRPVGEARRVLRRGHARPAADADHAGLRGLRHQGLTATRRPPTPLRASACASRRPGCWR
jgi:SAM-dependent methyltransferase